MNLTIVISVEICVNTTNDKEIMRKKALYHIK